MVASPKLSMHAQPEEAGRQSPCSASVVVPARDEASRVGSTLEAARESLTRAGVPHEIIVVDNGSTDATAAVAGEKGAIVVAAADAATVAAVRNRGASLARGRLLCFLDADVLVSSGWGERIRESLASASPGVAWISGNECTADDSDSWIQSTWFGVRGRDRNHVNAANMIVPRRAFLDLGGFDEKLSSGEDYEICQRALSKGWDVTNDERLQARHMRHPTTLTAFSIREFWHGAGDFQSWSTFRASKIAWVAVALWLLLGAALVVTVSSSRPIALVGPAIALGAVSLLAALRRRKRRLIDVLPLTFLYMVFFMARALGPAAAIVGSRGDLWRRSA